MKKLTLFILLLLIYQSAIAVTTTQVATGGSTYTQFSPINRQLVYNGSEFELYFYDGSGGTADNIRAALIDKTTYDVTLSDAPAKVDTNIPDAQYSYRIAADARIGTTYSLTSLYSYYDKYAVELFRDDDSMAMKHRGDAPAEMTTGFNETGAIPSIMQNDYYDPQTHIVYRKGASPNWELVARKTTQYSLYFNTFDSETVIKTLGDKAGYGTLVRYKNQDMGCVYSYNTGSGVDLYYKHFTNSTQTWGSEETISSAGCSGVVTFCAVSTINDVLFVAYVSYADAADVLYKTRPQSTATWGSEQTYVGDKSGANIILSGLYNDYANPDIVLFYFDGTDINKAVWEQGSTLGAGTVATPTAFLEAPDLISTTVMMFTSNIMAFDKLGLVYVESDGDIKIAVEDLTMANEVTDPIGIDAGLYGRTSDRLNHQAIVTNGEKTIITAVGIDGKSYARLYDEVNKTWSGAWVQVSNRYWDFHNRPVFMRGDDGYVWFLEGGRYNKGNSHYIKVYKSDYEFSSASFNLDVMSTWTDVSPTIDDADSDGVSDSCTRGYKEVFVDNNGVVFLVTATSYSMFVRVYDSGTWYDPVEVIETATQANDGGYWTENGIALGRESTGQQSLQVFYTYRDLDSYGSQYWVNFSSDLTFTKLVYQGTGTFKAYRADGTELTLPCNSVNNDVVVSDINAKPTYGFAEGFEGTGYENTGWGEFVGSPGSVDEDNTTSPGVGSQCCKIDGADYAQLYRTIYGSGSFSFMLKIEGTPGLVDVSIFQVRDSSYNLLSSIKLTNDNKLSITNGTATSSETSALTLDQWYYIWFDFTPGSGSNGTTYLYLSTTSTKPTATLSITNGTATVSGDDIVLGGYDSDLYIDDFKIISGHTSFTRENSTWAAIGEYILQDDHVFKCTTSGTTVASAPTFDTDHHATTTDGTAVWTEVANGISDTRINLFNAFSGILDEATPCLMQQFMTTANAFSSNKFIKWDGTNWAITTVETDANNKYLYYLYVNPSDNKINIFGNGLRLGYYGIYARDSDDEGDTFGGLYPFVDDLSTYGHVINTLGINGTSYNGYHSFLFHSGNTSNVLGRYDLRLISNIDTGGYPGSVIYLDGQ